jgi:hypothetical protein
MYVTGHLQAKELAINTEPLGNAFVDDSKTLVSGSRTSKGLIRPFYNGASTTTYKVLNSGLPTYGGGTGLWWQAGVDYNYMWLNYNTPQAVFGGGNTGDGNKILWFSRVGLWKDTNSWAAINTFEKPTVFNDALLGAGVRISEYNKSDNTTLSEGFINAAAVMNPNIAKDGSQSEIMSLYMGTEGATIVRVNTSLDGGIIPSITGYGNRISCSVYVTGTNRVSGF